MGNNNKVNNRSVLPFLARILAPTVGILMNDHYVAISCQQVPVVSPKIWPEGGYLLVRIIISSLWVVDGRGLLTVLSLLVLCGTCVW